MPECVRDRQGRVVGKRGLATRGRLLDALSGLVERAAWRRVTPIEVARTAGSSAATFYQYFEELEDAAIALAVRLDEAGGRFSDRLRIILCLLEIEGWKLPEFSNNSTIEEW